MGKLSKDEIINRITPHVKDKNLNDMSYKELVSLYNETQVKVLVAPKEELIETSKTDSKIDANDIVEKTEKDLVIINETKPLSKSDPKWTEYIMKQFTGDELFDGLPSRDGLCRVFEQEIGEIVTTNVNVVKPPTATDPSATVKVEIDYIDHDQDDSIIRRISDAFDVNNNNTKYPWCLAAVATATTKAEARALRKGLRLHKILSREEIEQGFDNNKDENSTGLANDGLKRAINNMISKSGIDMTKYLASKEKTSIDEISKEEAQIMLKELNDFAYNRIAIPDDIKIKDIKINEDI